MYNTLSLLYIQGEKMPRSQPWLRRNLGERNFGFDSLKYMNHDMEEKGIVSRRSPVARC
jgi:hypothetical protein